jgi:putative heme-binding domain-containing protein
MRDPGIAVFLKDPSAYVVAEAARAINDDLSIPDALPTLADLIKTSTSENEVIIRRSLNANLRLGATDNLMAVADYAKNTSKPLAMRVEAAEILGVWAKPSVLDRVDGRYRGEITRDLAITQTAAANTLIGLLSDNESSIRGAAAVAAGKLKLSAAGEALAKLIQREKDESVKALAVTAISKMGYNKMAEVLAIALKDKKASVRMAAIEQLTSGVVPENEADKLLVGVINSSPQDGEKQIAISSIAKLKTEVANSTLSRLVNDWVAGKLKPSLQLDLAEGLASSGRNELLAKIDAIKANAGTQSIYDQYQDCLEGGDAEKGQNTFWQNESAQCTRCHAMFDYGGNVGPKLDGIANVLSRRQLLESLVEPSKRVSPGYGVVSLELNDGKSISGILKEENERSLVVEDSNNEKLTIEKSAIAERVDAMSSMPPVQQRLSKREIRDMVAYLSTLTRGFH